MGSPIGGTDNGIGAADQFIVETAFDQSADHRLGGQFVMQGKASCVGAVHGLDDVAPNGKIAQRFLKSGLQCPAAGVNAFGLDFAGNRTGDLALAARSQFDRDPLLGARTQPGSDVIAVDDDVIAVRVRSAPSRNVVIERGDARLSSNS